MRVDHNTLLIRWAFHTYANPRSEDIPLSTYVLACSIVQQVNTERTLTQLYSSLDALFVKKGKGAQQ